MAYFVIWMFSIICNSSIKKKKKEKWECTNVSTNRLLGPVFKGLLLSYHIGATGKHQLG